MKRNFFHIYKSLVVLIFFWIIGCTSQPAPDPTQQPNTADGPSVFGKGAIASIARKDVENLSNEEIITVLLQQWLDGFKYYPANKDAIRDYKIEEISIQNHPIDADSELIARVSFAVRQINHSNNWDSIGVDTETIFGWSHVACTFSVNPGDEYLILRMLPGYGT